MESNQLQHPGLRGSWYKPLSDVSLKKIAEAVFLVLEKKGMAIYSPTAFEALKRAGATVEEATRIVKFPPALVEDAIASTPSSVTLHGRNSRHNAVLEENRVYYGTGGTALYVLDPVTGERRPSTVADLILNGRMVEQLDHVHVFTINVFPNEIGEIDAIDVNRFFHAFDNTTKHVMGGLYSMNGCKETVEMAEMIAGDPERLRHEPFVSFITLIISPFKIDEHYGEMACFLAGKGLPVVIPTEPICGTTSPITLAGNILSHVAETIGGIVLLQSVKKGVPGICGSVGSITNLRTMDHVGGAVERGMIHAGVAQLAQYFHLPLYSTGGCTDAREVDAQAAVESGMMNLLVAMSGANYIHDAAGLMEADLTVSYEKLALDNEILGMCQRVLRGIDVTDDALALDLILQKPPGEDYLGEMHTVEHMRSEFFMPGLADRDKRDSAKAGGNAFSRAHAMVEELRNKPRASLLDPENRRAILQRFPRIRVPED